MITVDTGELLRTATLDDATLIYETFVDWPNTDYRERLRNIRGNVERSIEDFSLSMLSETPIPQIPFAVTVMQDSAGGYVGVCEWTYHQGPPSGFDIHRLAIHPSKRGLGHYPVFSEGMAYLANQVLQADGGHYWYYADVQVGEKVLTREDRELRDRIAKGEVREIERPSTLKTTRDRMGGEIKLEIMPDFDARLRFVEMQKTTVATNLFSGRHKYSISNR